MQTPSSAKPRRPSWLDPWRCTVELLVVSGCPGTELAVARIREATEALGIETNLRFIIVEGERLAQELGFPGSPTVRGGGREVADDAEESAGVGPNERTVGVSCRLYSDGDKVEQAPPLAWIQAALAKAAPLLGPGQ